MRRLGMEEEWRAGFVDFDAGRRGSDRAVVQSRIGSEDWQGVEEPIPIRWVPCRYGGRRPYFVCPGIVNGVACHRQAVKLYCAGRYNWCRNCYRLTHTSRNEDSCDRALRPSNKIRMRLGGEPGYEAMIPRRPKSMWRKTYDRLFEAVIDNESLADERLARITARLLDLDRRLGTKTRNPKKGYW